LVNGKRFTVSISVRLRGKEATIDVFRDGRPLCHSTASPSVFPAYHFWDSFQQVRPVVGVEAGSDATFHSARVRVSAGKGEVKPRRLTEPSPLSQWIDLLPRIDLARDRLDGEFYRVGGNIRLDGSRGQGVLMLPAALQGSYELQMEILHTPASGMISFVLPVGARRVRVNANTRGDLHPDPGVINRPQMQGENRKKEDAEGNMKAGVRHLLCLKVEMGRDTAAIDVRVDGRPWLAWSGRQEELYDGPGRLTESDRVGLIADGALTLSAARLRVTSGKGYLVVSEPMRPRP
jgi:hypothetical protein